MILSSYFPILFPLVATGFVLLILHFFRVSQRGRRNPIKGQLLRSPGEALRNQLEDVNTDISAHFVTILIVPFAMYSSFLSLQHPGDFWITTYLLMWIVICAFCAVKLWRLLKLRNNYRLGLDCELAVGQELNQLMLNGCRVFHDFPADKFNIDHVFVGPKGVFAVETKGRAKSDKKGGTAEATVIYDGESLNFPNGKETGYLDQAKRQAKWLSQWLSSAVGESVSVKPVLALPGWFIERKKPSDMLIFNGKNPDFILKWSNNVDLSETLVKRIAHQLEQRCRDVDPVAYSKKAQGK